MDVTVRDSEEGNINCFLSEPVASPPTQFFSKTVMGHPCVGVSAMQRISGES